MEQLIANILIEAQRLVSSAWGERDSIPMYSGVPKPKVIVVWPTDLASNEEEAIKVL